MAKQRSTPRKPKVLAVASPGGHWVQLNRICNPLEDRFEVVYVTPGAFYSFEKDASRKNRVINVTDASSQTKLRIIPLAFQLLAIIVKERPKAIVSTGAAPGAIAVLLAKYLPIKTIWIDSIANTTQLSHSGRLVLKHADQVLTQWESLSDGDTILYRGSIL